MNPKHLYLNVDPADGRIWLVMAKPSHPRKRIKELSDEILLCLCADISASVDEGCKAIERTVKFQDGMECKVSVELVKPPSWAKSGVRSQHEGVTEFGGLEEVVHG